MTTSMHIDLRVGETLQLAGADGAQISITLGQKSGQRARLSVQAPPSVEIKRPSARGDKTEK